jgi:hypothetical protein
LAKQTFILVGADKGGVGKTTLSRTIVEYFTALNLPLLAFDTETPHGALLRYHPSITTLVDIYSTIDQRKIFEPAQGSPPVILVDFRAGTFLQTLATLKKIGIIDRAEEGEFDILLMHLLAPSMVSLQEQTEVQPYRAACKHFVVQSFAGKSAFFQDKKDVVEHYIGDIPSEQRLQVPTLNQMAFEAVDLLGTTFYDFATGDDPDTKSPQHSLVLRGYTQSWLGTMWDEYDRIGLRDIVLNNFNLVS